MKTIKSLNPGWYTFLVLLLCALAALFMNTSCTTGLATQQKELLLLFLIIGGLIIIITAWLVTPPLYFANARYSFLALVAIIIGVVMIAYAFYQIGAINALIKANATLISL